MPFVPNLQSCYCSFWGLDALNSFPHLGQYYCCLLDLELSTSFLSSFFPWGLCFGSLRQGDLLTTPSEKLSLILRHSSFIALMTINACVVYLLIFPLFVFLYWSGFSNNPFLLVQKGISYWFWVAYEILYKSGSRQSSWDNAQNSTTELTTAPLSLYKARIQEVDASIVSSRTTLPLQSSPPPKWAFLFLGTHEARDRILGSLLKRLQNTPNLWQEQQKYSIYLIIFTLIFKSHWVEGSLLGEIWITVELELWEDQGNATLGFLVFNAGMESPEPASVPCWNVTSMRVGTLSAHPSPCTHAKLMPDMCNMPSKCWS